MNLRRFQRCVLTLAFFSLVAIPFAEGAENRNVQEVPSYPTKFTTSLGPNWKLLVGRKEPFQKAPVRHQYTTGDKITVTRYTDLGQFISRGKRYGYGSTVWYFTSNGCWIWSGGTADPKWNKSNP